MNSEPPAVSTDAKPMAMGKPPAHKLRSPVLVVVTLVAIVVIAIIVWRVASPTGPSTDDWVSLEQPTNAQQLTLMPFGTRSQYLQPWRAYLDTPSGSALSSALGINFNVTPAEAEATAAALQQAGFTRVRLEIGWSSMDPAHSGALRTDAVTQYTQILAALKRHNLRPLVLLNGNEGVPGPTQFFTVHLTAPAAQGARTVTLDPGDMSQIVPGRSGFNSLTGQYQAAATLFTAVNGNTITLSAPLPRALTPGAYPAATLGFEPFSSPTTASGQPNSRFQTTLSGWLAYVDAVTRLVKQNLGSDQFDVEVWNELTFGSDFLNLNNYYYPAIDPQAPPQGPNKAVMTALLQSTLNRIRQNAMPNVQVGDGFADQVPWTSGANEVPGIAAIDKHLYQDAQQFPAGESKLQSTQPLDAFGQSMGTSSVVNGEASWSDAFVPTYQSFFPEYYLTGIQTETIVRDLAPITTDIYGTPHGRDTHPPGAPAPKVWMTEYNLPAPTAMTPTQTARFKAKVVLRYLISMVNKGVAAVDFYAAKEQNPSLSLIDPAFYTAIDHGQAAPSPGLPLQTLQRLTKAAQPTGTFQPTPINVQGLTTTDTSVEFAGNATYPPLRHLDEAAVFPFQNGPGRYLIAAYVMTRDLYRPWSGDPRSPTRYDLPAAPYRITLSGLGCGTNLQALDPLTGASWPVSTFACNATQLRIQVPLTDYPILITATARSAISQPVSTAHSKIRRYRRVRRDQAAVSLPVSQPHAPAPAMPQARTAPSGPGPSAAWTRAVAAAQCARDATIFDGGLSRADGRVRRVWRRGSSPGSGPD